MREGEPGADRAEAARAAVAAPGRRRVARLGARSLASIADQGAAAALAFAASVAVGRVLGAEALGLFAMTGVLVLAIRQLQAGAILEPMSVFGARRPAADRGGYLGFVLALHGLGVGAPTLVLAAATGLATAAGLVGSAGWAVVAALVYANAVALLNLLRRQFYVDERPDLALAQSVAVLGLSLAGLVLLALAGRGRRRRWASSPCTGC